MPKRKLLNKTSSQDVIKNFSKINNDSPNISYTKDITNNNSFQKYSINESKSKIFFIYCIINFTEKKFIEKSISKADVLKMKIK